MSCFCFAVTCLVLISAVPVFSEVQIVNADNIDDTRASTVRLADNHGYVCEEHNVTTGDKFKLKVHRLIGKKNGTRYNKKLLPVFLQHCLLDTSADWLIQGPGKALAYILSDLGYDVWMGNARGNVYSRKHLTLKPDDDKFWDWSWHEMGFYDLPAEIEYVLKKTNKTQLNYVGHSVGTTMFYVMCSTWSKCNEKVRSMVSLAPVAYLSHMTSTLRIFADLLSTKLSQRDKWWMAWGFYFINGRGSYHPGSDPLMKLMRAACEMSHPDERDCFDWKDYLLDFSCGEDPGQVEERIRPIIKGHNPAGTSTKTILHYGQIIASGKFQNYDYYDNKTNEEHYNVTIPPLYELSKVTVPVTLYYGDKDWCVRTDDVEQLNKELGNSKGIHKVNLPSWDHMDFVWAKDANSLVYKQIVDLFENN